MNKVVSSSLLLLIILFSSYSYTIEKKIDIGKPVITSEELVPKTKEVSIPKGATIEEKINILIEEIERLKKIAMRATLIITVELEPADRQERAGVKITLSGGKLKKPAVGVSDKFGNCVFIVEPLSGKNPYYRIKIEKEKYVSVEREIFVEPAQVALIPIRVELTEFERQRRLTPPLLR